MRECRSRIIPEIRRRKSCRSYTDQVVDPKDVKSILEAGNMAPTGRNRQNLLLAAVVDKRKVAVIKEFLGGGKEYYNAPVIILVLEREQDNLTIQNASSAMTNMMLECQHLQLGSCWIHCTVEKLNSPQGKKMLKDVLPLENEMNVVETLAVGHIMEEGVIKERNARNIKIC